MKLETSDDVVKALESSDVRFRKVIESISSNTTLIQSQIVWNAVVEHALSHLPQEIGDDDVYSYSFIYIASIARIKEWVTSLDFCRFAIKGMKHLEGFIEGHLVLEALNGALDLMACDEFNESIAWCIRQSNVEWGSLSKYVDAIHCVPELVEDEAIVDALKSRIQDIADGIADKDYIFESTGEPWNVIPRINKIPWLVKSEPIQRAIDSAVEAVVHALSTPTWEGSVLKGILDSPELVKRAGIQAAIAGNIEYLGDDGRDAIRNNDILSNSVVVRQSLGEWIDSTNAHGIGDAIEANVKLLRESNHPWSIIRTIKDIPELWKNPAIQGAAEKRISFIADAIREPNPWKHHIILALLHGESKLDNEVLADVNWALRSPEIDSAIRDTANDIIHEIVHEKFSVQLQIKGALSQAGVGNGDLNLPERYGSYGRENGVLQIVVDLKGWEYVQGILMKRLEKDASQAQALLELVPTKDHLFYENEDYFPGLWGRIIPLLVPYRPQGLLERLHELIDAAWSFEGFDDHLENWHRYIVALRDE